MKYLIGGTWRHLNAQGLCEPFALEVEASSEKEAREIVHSDLNHSKYEHILIKTVIANFHAKSHSKECWHIRANLDTLEVHLMITDLGWFLQSEGDSVVFACDVGNQQFRIEKNQLSNFWQL